MDLEKRLAFAEQIAREAGDLVLQSFQLVKDFKFKDDESPVTSADLAAEELLRDRIMREFPGEEILGEEHGGDPESADRWVLDPIDGTKSFMACVPRIGSEGSRHPVQRRTLHGEKQCRSRQGHNRDGWA